ncbi:MAG TPA: L-seryl-tRNA(Sec) selenium transferase [Haloplasmataceae bacterium]
MDNLYKQLPQVAKLLEDPNISQFSNDFFHKEIKMEIEKSLRAFRKKIEKEEIKEIDYNSVVLDIVNRLKQKNKYSLRKVINGTGTIVHTNLGRSLLSKQAIEHVVDVCTSYNNLEYNIECGCRGSRYDHVEKLMAEIVGSEACLIVNNNAAATMLCVATFGKDKEVIVSRGELVEIGGSFRIPEIIAVSEAILKEVGTTNRTHLKDYENNTTENTAMYLKVHPSNYHILGFTKSVTNEEIVKLAKKMNQNRNNKIITMEDIGSGVLIDLSSCGLKEDMVKESIKSGIDLVTFSGDKLLGGPQAGVIAGRKHLIDKIKSHPLLRALRVGKMTIAALEGTLREYYDEKKAINSIPTLAMIFVNKKTLHEKALKLSNRINNLSYIKSEVIEVKSTVGGGALPLSELPSYGVSVFSDKFTVLDMERYLRMNKTPIIGRIYNDQYVLDVRTLVDGDEDIIIDALGRLGDL